MDRKKAFKYYFGCEPDIFPGSVLVTPFISPKRFKDHCSSSAEFRGMLYSGFIAKKGAKSTAVVNCGMGDRLMGDAVLLLGETRMERLVFAGACGGLGSSAIGDLIVCSGAFPGEGFSRYAEKPFDIDDILRFGEIVPASVPETSKLLDFALKESVDASIIRKGSVFTIGSLVAEDRDTLDRVKDGGFSGIDIELSAVLKAAENIGCRASAMVFVSDLPAEKPLWEPLSAEEKTRYNKGVSELVRLSVGSSLSY